MAIGSKGSFAKVDPKQGILDTSQIADDAFKVSSQVKEQKRLLDQKVRQKRQGLLDNLESIDPKAQGLKTFDEIDYSYVDDLREKAYDAKKKIQNGEMSISEGNALVSNYNRKVGEYKTLRSSILPAVQDFATKYGEGKLSAAIDDDLIEVTSKIVDGDIEEVKSDSNGNPTVKVNDRKYDLKKLYNFYSSAPPSFDYKGDASGIVENFIASQRTVQGIGLNAKGEKVREFYSSLKEVGISDVQEKRLRNKARQVVNTPKYQNHLYYKMTGESLSPSEIKEQGLVEEMERFYADKYVEVAKTEMKSIVEEKTNIGQQSIDAKRQREEEEGQSSFGDVQPANIDQYGDAVDIIDKEDCTKVGFCNAMEIPVLNENFRLNSFEGYVKDEKGQSVIKRLDNVTIRGITMADDGDIYIRGNRLKSEGGTIKKPGVKTVEDKKITVTQGEIDDLEAAKTNEEMAELIDKMAKDKKVTREAMSEAIKTPPQYSSFSMKVPKSSEQAILERSPYTREELKGIMSVRQFEEEN